MSTGDALTGILPRSAASAWTEIKAIAAVRASVSFLMESSLGSATSIRRRKSLIVQFGHTQLESVPLEHTFGPASAGLIFEWQEHRRFETARFVIGHLLDDVGCG